MQLVAIRIAHQPGFDRLVFEFGPSALGSPGIPAYSIESSGALAGASGQAVPIAGNALFGIRFQNSSTRSPSDGSATYTGSTDLRPTTPLLREVRLVDDFERVLVWGAGTDRLACPAVLTLVSPVRVVLDFLTPP